MPARARIPRRPAPAATAGRRPAVPAVVTPPALTGRADRRRPRIDEYRAWPTLTVPMLPSGFRPAPTGAGGYWV